MIKFGMILTILSVVAGVVHAQPATPSAAASSPVLDLFRDQLAKRTAAALASFQSFRIDTSVPTSPAFSVLGATPATILQPHSPRDLAVSLVQGLSDSDKLGNGVGFDIAPYMLWKGSTLTLKEYRDSEVLQRLANLQLSFAAIKSEVSGKNVTKAAFGLALPLMDAADPRSVESGLQPCFDRAVKDKDVAVTVAELNAALAGQVIGNDQAVRAALLPSATRLSAAWDTCRESFKQQTWSGTRWLAGLGQAYDNRDGGIGRSTRNFWSTYTVDMGSPRDAKAAEIGGGPRGQVLLHLRRTDSEEMASTTDARGFTLRSGWTYAVGYRYGSDKRNLSLEASVARSKFDTGERENSRKLAVGSELQLNKDFWLVIALGGEGGLKGGKSTPFALASIKFGAASESTGAFGPAALVPK